MNSSHKLLAAVNNQTNLLLLPLVGTASPDSHTTASPGGAVFSIHNPGDVPVHRLDTNQTNLLLLPLVGTASPDSHTTASPGGAVFSIHNPGDVSVINALASGQEKNCAA